MSTNYQDTIFNEEEIIKELSAPIKSIRLLALEEVISKGCSPKLLERLLNLSKTETDEECKLLLKHAINAVSSRLNKSSFDQQSYTKNPQIVIEKLFNSTDDEKIKILLNVPAHLYKFLTDWACKELEKSTNPVLILTIIKKLGKFLPDEIIQSLLPLLDNSNQFIKASVLSLIIEKNVNLLIPKINQLLSSQEIKIISLAIVALSKLNPDLAHKFITSKLKHSQSTNITSYEATIKALFLIPFNISKKAVLDVISYSNDVNLISKIGLLLQINPEPDTPFFLIEQIIKSDHAKRKILLEIFTNVCSSIKESQILGNYYNEWLKKIKDFLIKAEIDRKKKLNEIINLHEDYNQTILVPSTIIDEKDENSLVTTNNNNYNNIRNNLFENKSENNKPSLENFDINKNLDTFYNLTYQERINILKTILYNKSSTQLINPSTLESIIKSEKNCTEIQKLCIQIAHKYIYQQFKIIAFEYLHSKDEDLVATSLDYLSEFDLDKLTPYLGNFLNSSSYKIRLSAFRILIKHDFEQAIEFVINLVNNINPKQQDIGLAFLNEIEFRLIREKVVELIETTKNEKLLKTFLNLTTKNPDLENLFLLYRLSKTLNEFTNNINNEYKKQITLIKELNLASEEKIKEFIETFPTRYKQILSKLKNKYNKIENKTNIDSNNKNHQEENYIIDVIIGTIIGIIMLILFLILQ